MCIFFLVNHMINLWYRIDPGDGTAPPYSSAEFWKMSGFLPGFMTFSSFDEKEQYTYLGLVLLIAGTSFLDALRKWIREDSNSKELGSIEQEQEAVKYAKQFLCCWDHSLANDTDVEDLQCNIGAEMAALLDFEKEKDNTKARSFKENVLMNFRRGEER